ncbi:MAG: peptide deformylase [Parcubacteria group bacterium CG11_big_fil_rev_8_21_14_0_20_39_22]|nr:MAG: peptide deformylase [Parcubacteria group bacterium CG11_big_fil_rev_8_21_14_0_20_39_22]
MAISKSKTRENIPEILQRDNPILRQISKEVPVEKITSDEIQSVIADMKAALLREGDGVGIAAPQIGVSLRIFVVAHEAVAMASGDRDLDSKSLALKKEARPEDDLVFINPVITKKSKETEFFEEGCLSVRYAYGKIKRHKKVTLVAYDETGKKTTRGASGLLAEIFQHEVDHLNGTLFIDNAKDIQEIPPESLTDSSL